MALALGLALLGVVGNGGAKTTAPDLLLLDPIGTFDHPTFVTSPPGDESRLFVVQQPGQIMLVKSTGTTTFMTVPNVFSTTAASAACSRWPSRPTTRRAASSTSTTRRARDGDIQVDEFHRDASNPDLGDPSTRRAVITVPHPNQSNHNGGQLQFGPDGMLYMGTGDGGGGGDPFRTGQNLQDLRGKILRIDPRQNGGEPYAVPANNPFVGQAPWKPEIWAYGVRNPWRFSFDRVTGDFTLGDVGQNTWEEIDYRPISEGWGRGVNFGWSCMEGRHLYGNCPEPPNDTLPVYEYNHNIGGCSITGGYVGRDQEVPSLLREVRLRGLLQRADLVEPARDSRRDRQPRGDGYLAPGPEPHVIRRGRVRAHVRHGSGQRAQRVPDPAARPARPVLHAAIRPAGPDRARRGRLHDRAQGPKRPEPGRRNAARGRLHARGRRQLDVPQLPSDRRIRLLRPKAELCH